jgi:hypothetical protein
MKKNILYGLAAILAGTTLHAQEEAAVKKEIEQARQIIEEYVETRREIAKASNEWRSYQELSVRRISLYEQEIAELTAAIEKAEAETTQAERAIAKIKGEIAELRQANDIVAQALPGFEDELRELYQYFPTPLKDKVQSLVQQLGKGGQASNRMALVIGILNEVDKFNSDYTLDTFEKTLPSGQTKLVDVVYLGLAVAYYADSDGKFGGVGIPAPGDWEWSEKNDLAPAIREAILYYEGEIKPAMLVDLPIEIQNISIGN